MDENMSQSAKHALRNTIISRSTVSKKIKVLDDSIIENITKSVTQPDILYIETDEIHANLQHGGIKNYENCFPNAKFVLDPFHYIRKHLAYIFKDNNELKNIADDYIRSNLIDDFKTLVNCQIEQYPEQKNI